MRLSRPATIALFAAALSPGPAAGLRSAEAASAAPAGGGEPVVDLDASALGPGPVDSWPNAGFAGGSFRCDAYGGAASGVVAGRPAVTFDGRGHRLRSTFPAPAGITGRSPYTVAVWAHNPEVAGEECLVQWARRGTTSRTAQLNYGTSRDFGAVTHWGGHDMGFDAGVPKAGEWHHIAVTYEGGEDAVETLYVDGEVSAVERKTLDLWPGCPVRLANADGEKIFSGSLAGVRIYDRALAPGEVAALAGRGGAAPEDAPLVDLRPEDLAEGPVSAWPNRGTLGGGFGLESSSPVATEVAGRAAVLFEGGAWLQSDFAAAAAVRGEGPLTVELRVHNAAVSGGREAILSWAPLAERRRVEFGYGMQPVAGAFSAPPVETPFRGVPKAGAWHDIAYVLSGGADGTLRIYVDGELNTEKACPLDARVDERMVLGGVWEPPRGAASVPFTGALARARVFDRALSHAEVRNSIGLFAAFGASPKAGEELTGLEATLRWQKGAAGAESFDVYLGADRGEVERAGRAPGPGAAGAAYRGNVRAPRTSFGPLALALGGTYFWRINQLDAEGRARWRGEVWSFRAATGNARSPSPRDRLAGVDPATAALAWSPGRYALGQRVHLGTSREDVEAGRARVVEGLGGRATGCPVPGGRLEPGTTYWWRVEGANGDLPTSAGEVWAFRTADAPVPHDVTFFVATDTHYGASETIAAAGRATIDFMNFLPGVAYPDGLGGGPVGTPRGVVICGDLTNNGTPEEWAQFAADFGIDREGRLGYPVYELWGNHDGRALSAVRRGIRERNPRRPGVASVSENGLHYSWDWDDLHLVAVNVYPGSADDPEGAFKNEPERSIEFLRDDLARNVGPSGRPVVIFQHFGWDDFSFSWNWWTEGEREAFFEAVRGYNVACVFHGHSHAASVKDWRGLTIANVGAVQRDPAPGECFVVRVSPGEIILAHRFADRWGLVWRKPVTWGRARAAGLPAGVDPE